MDKEENQSKRNPCLQFRLENKCTEMRGGEDNPNYKTKTCRHYMKKDGIGCVWGDECQYLHTEVDVTLPTDLMPDWTVDAGGRMVRGAGGRAGGRMVRGADAGGRMVRGADAGAGEMVPRLEDPVEFPTLEDAVRRAPPHG